MKITDMNLICLEECFEYLKLDDLLNVADANKRLCKAAQFVYYRKYGETPVYFGDAGGRNVVYILINFESNWQYIWNLKNSLRFLRCFGQLIKYVQILFDTSKTSYQRIFTQLNEYCSESLVYIRFCGVKNEEFKLLTKPFVKVKNVLFYKNCNLTENGWLTETFPKMESLRYQAILAKDDIPIGLIDYIPHLEHLEFSGNPSCTKEQIASILRLNPQLKELNITMRTKDSSFDLDTFRNVIEPMKNLEELILNGKYFCGFVDNKVYSLSVKQFDISSSQLKYPFRFDQLEHFKVNNCNKFDSQLTAEFYDFIDQHPTIRNFSYSCSKIKWSTINFTRLTKAIPFLTEIAIKYLNLVSVDDVLRLISSFKFLESINFGVIYVDKTFYDKLRARLGNEWKIKSSHCSIHMWNISIIKKVVNRNE